MSDPAPAGLSGGLDLVFASTPGRGTFLARQSFSAPMHLSKTYWDGDILLVNVINQTAGVFGGDSIGTQIVVEPGARVLLSSPSACRFHPSRGRDSRLEQAFHVRAGGSLDVFPELCIPQQGSRSIQKTQIDVEAGGALLYLETFAPGRVASGESFAFEHYSWRTEIRVGGRPVHRERASIRPDTFSCSGLRSLFPSSYYAGIVLVSPAAEKWDRDFQLAVAELGGDRLKIAASKLNASGWSIRLLADDSVSLRRGIAEARQLVYAKLGRPLPNTRRNA